jgi:hypothetical protein
MRSAFRLLAFGLAVPLALAAFGAGTMQPASGASDDGSYAINIKDFMFTPRKLMIPGSTRMRSLTKSPK